SVSSATARAPLVVAAALAVAVGVGVAEASTGGAWSSGSPLQAATAPASANSEIQRVIGSAFPKRAQTGKRQSMKEPLIQPDRGQDAIAIHLVNKDGFEEFARKLSGPQRAALAGQNFKGAGYEVGIVPDGDGWFAVGGVKNPGELSSWCMAKLAAALPAGTYRLAEGEPGPASHGWQTAQYRFSRYKEEKEPIGPRILLTTDVKAIEPALAEAAAVALVRDLVNTPAEDMGPAALEAQAETIAKAHGATLSITRGEALEREYPMVHAVGRAAARSH